MWEDGWDCRFHACLACHAGPSAAGGAACHSGARASHHQSGPRSLSWVADPVALSTRRPAAGLVGRARRSCLPLWSGAVHALFRRGETWCWPRVILDSGLDDRDAGILETPSGTLLATTFTSLAYQPILERARKEGRWDRSRLRRWEAAHARLDAASRQSQLGQWILRSEDGGLNWSAKTPSVVNSPHGPIALSNGRLLYAGKLWTGGQRRIGVAFSEDDGRSWQWAAEIPAREGDDPAEYHELHAVEMPDRRVVVHIRNHNPSHAGETLQCESTDGGLSWTKPRSVGVWGLPSHLLRLADGRALMTYGHRRPPFGNQARLSEDGRSWSAPISLSTDGASGDLGYPSTAQLTDGSLVSVWYERLANHPKAVLRQARWSLEA